MKVGDSMLETIRQPEMICGGLWAVATEMTQPAPTATIVCGAIVTVLVVLGRYAIDRAYMLLRDYYHIPEAATPQPQPDPKPEAK